MGHIRGKRNRDSDRYWHERRRTEQAGMVGAVDVSVCCFCGCLVVSDEAGYTKADELFCVKCGTQRGLIHTVKVRSKDSMSTLASVDILAYEEGSTLSRGGPRLAHLVGCKIITGGWQHALHGYCNSSLDRSGWTRRRKETLYTRAVRWLERDSTVALEDVHQEAISILSVHPREARAALIALRRDVYRQSHKPQALATHRRVIVEDQARAIRELYATGLSTYRIAVKYCVSSSTIHQIVTGSTFKTAGGPVIAVRSRGQYGNVNKLEATVCGLSSDGRSLREIARFTRLSRATVRKILRRERVIVGICGCGRPGNHNGWCQARYQRSPARQAFMSKWHKREKSAHAAIGS